MFPETPFFHEFVIKSEQPVDEVLEHLLEHDILADTNSKMTILN